MLYQLKLKTSFSQTYLHEHLHENSIYISKSFQQVLHAQAKKKKSSKTNCYLKQVYKYQNR